jgi:acyl-CoA thioester hydrolase
MSDESLLTVSPRPDPRRQVPALYPLRYLSRLRFADLDTLGHLNNVAHSGLHEDGRTMLCEQIFPAIERPRGLRHMVAQNTLHFLAEAFYPGELLVCAGIGRVGRTSYVTSTALFSGDNCVSIADSVMVVQQDRALIRLSPADRAACEGHWLGTS